MLSMMILIKYWDPQFNMDFNTEEGTKKIKIPILHNIILLHVCNGKKKLYCNRS
jgi:hypothetical protein